MQDDMPYVYAINIIVHRYSYEKCWAKRITRRQEWINNKSYLLKLKVNLLIASAMLSVVRASSSGKPDTPPSPQRCSFNQIGLAKSEWQQFGIYRRNLSFWYQADLHTFYLPICGSEWRRFWIYRSYLSFWKLAFCSNLSDSNSCFQDFKSIAFSFRKSFRCSAAVFGRGVAKGGEEAE